MRNFSILAALCLLALLGTSCSSTKSIVYIQGAEELYRNGANMNDNYTLNIQPDDQLAIYLTSRDEELMKPFSNLKMIGNTNGSTGTMGSQSYFTVTRDGYIDFPIFGKIKAAGKTVEKLSEELQNRMVAEGLIKDAQITTKIMSFKVTVLGAVNSPGVKTCSGERLTLLEAIGQCGDLTNTAIRKNVLVVREENGQRKTYAVDLTDPESVFNSPAYYLHQNDLVYVEPNGSEKVKGSPGYQYLGLTTSLLGMGTSIASLIIALTK